MYFIEVFFAAEQCPIADVLPDGSSCTAILSAIVHIGIKTAGQIITYEIFIILINLRCLI
jgi:hypothetical protein